MPQDQLIRDSFEVVHEMPEAIAMLFYGRLFNLEPSLRGMFKIDMHTQSRKLMDMLTAVVDSLDHHDDGRQCAAVRPHNSIDTRRACGVW